MSSVPVANLAIPLWTLRREAALNWLALGVLLAAWNASYNDVPREIRDSRPNPLRGYPCVSVRACRATGHTAVNVL